MATWARGPPLGDLDGNSPRGRPGQSKVDDCQPARRPASAPAAAAAPAQVSAEVMRKADQMLVRATEKLVMQNRQIVGLNKELKDSRRRERELRKRHGADESSERRLAALKREYDTAEAVCQLQMSEATSQLRRHERENQLLQRRLDEQGAEMATLVGRARRAESSGEEHRAATARLKEELSQLKISTASEVVAANREVRVVQDELHEEMATRKAAAHAAGSELQQLQDGLRAEAERAGAEAERASAAQADVQSLREQLDTARADAAALAQEANHAAQTLETVHTELCDNQQAADSAMAGWDDEKVVRLRLQQEAAQKEQAAAAAASLEQSMALATIGEMQQLRAEHNRLTAELQQAALSHRMEVDRLNVQLTDAARKAEASEKATKKQATRDQEDATSLALAELESVRTQLRSEREVEDATAVANRELENVRAELQDEMEARLDADTQAHEARKAADAAKEELETLRQEHELQQLVVGAAAAPPMLPQPSPMGRISIAEFVQEQEARAAAESKVEEETERRLQAEVQLEETVALAEDATSKFETLTVELAAVQKGRGALLMEIEHQHASCAAASERVEQCEAETAAAQEQVAELATCQEQAATLQIELIAAAKLLDVASTGLEMEKRKSGKHTSTPQGACDL